MHASGEVTKIQKRLFNCKMELEASRGENSYLVWKQKDNIFVAVNRFNVATFWNTLTGKIIYKKILEGPSRIEHA